MSIVIAVIDQNQRLFLAADKRGIKTGTGKVVDNCKKIFKIRCGLYFAITGTLELGLNVRTDIRMMADEPVSEILKATELAHKKWRSDKHKLAVTIAGQREDGNFFSWGIDNAGSHHQKDGSSQLIEILISTNDQIDKYDSYLADKLSENDQNVELAIKATLEFAASTDCSISPEYDFFVYPHC